jgi:broad specificity phosphatase PhoE
VRFILVRHGRPNEIDSETPSDPSLNNDGWRQARAVSKLLTVEGVTRIVASPMLRAQQTAQPLAERLGLGINTVEGWAEADRGAHRYRSTETLRAEGGETWQRF